MDIDGTLPANKMLTMKRPEAVTLLEKNRMRNVGWYNLRFAYFLINIVLILLFY